MGTGLTTCRRGCLGSAGSAVPGSLVNLCSTKVSKWDQSVFATPTLFGIAMVRSIAQAYKDAYGGLPKEIWILSLALFINRFGAMVLAFLTLYLTNRLDFTMVEAGGILSAFGLGSLVGSFASGKLCRPLGAIRTQIIGLLVAVPCCLMVPLFESWTGVASMMFLFSGFSESVRPANNVAVSQLTTPEQTTRAFGLQRMAVNLGFSFGPAIGGVLAEIDFVWLFVVDGITTCLGGLILLWFFGFRKYAKDKATAKRQQLAESERGHGSPLFDLQFVAFLSILLGVGLIFFQFHATYPKYLEEHYSMSKPMIGLMFSINTAIIVAIEMILVDKLKDRPILKVIGWGAFLSCLGFAILPFGTTIWVCAISMIVITSGEMLLFPFCSSFVAQRSRGRDQGAYMSWFAMNFSLSAILAPSIGTFVYELNPSWLWYWSGYFSLIGLGGYYLLSKNELAQRDNPKIPEAISAT